MQAISSFDLIQLFESLKSTPSESLESECLEFKGYRDAKALNNAKELAEEVSALANKKGGLIIVGVQDSSNVVHGNWEAQLTGFPNADTLEIRERLVGRLQPKLEIDVQSFEHGENNYILIHVPRRGEELVGTSSGKFCIRDGRSSRPMTPAEIEREIKSLSKYDWSSEILEKLDPFVCLDPAAIEEALQDFCNRRGSRPSDISAGKFLEAIGASRNGELTKGGLLFLGLREAIQTHLGDFEYRFSWKTKGGALPINDVWSGCLWQAIKRTKSHFSTCNSISPIEFDGKTYSVPLLDDVAFHEAYLNAVVHRDYSVDGMVAVNFTNDKLIITSPGGFYGGVTADNIAIHEPRHRNKGLAQILMNFQMIDRAGMGVLRMGLASLRYGRKFPEFRELDDSVEVTMQAERLRPGIFVLTTDGSHEFGLVELLVLNDVYESGYTSVRFVEKQIRSLTKDPWHDITHSIDSMPYVEFCGTNKDVFIRVSKHWEKLFKVTKRLRPTTTSEKHLALYKFLRTHGEASNEDITPILGYKYSSQTSMFLRKAEYVRRIGAGKNARWSIVNAY